VIPDAFTKNQFRNKAKKLAQLAKAFHEKEEVPPQDLRPVFTTDDINVLRESNRDTRTTAEKFAEIEEITVFSSSTLTGIKLMVRLVLAPDLAPLEVLIICDPIKG
jgi:hypothetical protein